MKGYEDHCQYSVKAWSPKESSGKMRLIKKPLRSQSLSVFRLGQEVRTQQKLTPWIIKENYEFMTNRRDPSKEKSFNHKINYGMKWNQNPY